MNDESLVLDERNNLVLMYEFAENIEQLIECLQSMETSLASEVNGRKKNEIAMRIVKVKACRDEYFRIRLRILTKDITDNYVSVDLLRSDIESKKREIQGFVDNNRTGSKPHVTAVDQLKEMESLMARYKKVFTHNFKITENYL